MSLRRLYRRSPETFLFWAREIDALRADSSNFEIVRKIMLTVENRE